MKIKNSRLAIILPLVFALIFVGGLFLGLRLSQTKISERILLNPQRDKLSSLVDFIEKYYVDTVSREKLTEGAIISILKGLDPHSVYIRAEELAAVNEPLEGNFSGIGVQFNMQNDTIIVVSTVPNGPSQKVGILAGDRIVLVNDTVVAGRKMQSDVIVAHLKGERGTTVKVSIKRPGVKDLLSFLVTRDLVPLYSVDIAYIIKPGLGYIKINKFARDTYQEFNKAVEKLHQLGMKTLILDLRGNSGGYMDAATNIADEFLPKGKLIVYTRGKNYTPEDIYSTGKGKCQSDSLCVLIDELSASASEILAGAIQDNDRGIIIGRRSFGKGLVQHQTEFTDGSALRLTIARYYTPSGRCIQKSYGKGTDAYYDDLNVRYEHGEFARADSNKFTDTLKYRTSKGRIVYGGGGIMPDVFVPIDSLLYSETMQQIRNRALIYRFAFEWVDKNRSKLKPYKTFDQISAYLKKQDLLQQFIRYAEQNGLKLNSNQVLKAEDYIRIELHAYIARNLIDNEGFYPILAEEDLTLKRAIDYYKGSD
jgi:carboxyl-terminal processing protease